VTKLSSFNDFQNRATVCEKIAFCLQRYFYGPPCRHRETTIIMIRTWLSAMSRVTSLAVQASAARDACDWQSSSTTPTQRSNSAMVSSNWRHSNIMSSNSTLRRLSSVLARSKHAEIWRPARVKGLTGLNV